MNNFHTFSTPPPAALIKTGKPIFFDISFAFFGSETPSSEPSITGKPYFLQFFLLGFYHPSFLLILKMGQ